MDYISSIFTVQKLVWLCLVWDTSLHCRKKNYTLNIKKIGFSPKVPIQPSRPKTDSCPPGAIWAQFKPKQLHQKQPIPAHGAAYCSPWVQISPTLIKGAKRDSKIGLYFTQRNSPIFRAETDLSDLKCNDNNIVILIQTLMK